jgi:Tfp pilus assembly protein PilF
LSVNREGRSFDAFLDYNYGRFLAKRNQLVDAKKHLDKAVQTVPDFRATWYDRAKIGLRMGDYAQARSASAH